MLSIAISIQGLKKDFGPNRVIGGVDLSVRRGEVVAFVGPSGCGKSTFLRIIAGLEAEYSGSVFVEGKRPDDLSGARSVGFLSQEGSLLPWRSAVENVLLPIDLVRRRSANDIEAAKEILRQLGLHEYLGFRPRMLSGGMRQRVALAQLLVMNFDLILLDEPFTKLDEPLRWQLTTLVGCYLRGRTALWVTHSVDEALAIADRVFIWFRKSLDAGFSLLEVEGLRNQAFQLDQYGLPNLSQLQSRSREILAKQIELNRSSNDFLPTLAARPE
ncbi:ABC transporter ATP-binding protein [Bradyrhizobium sp. 930_D9_N1_4]|uniref:ABC transporter ATP-binding protein n=1 Tax=Bradyrhizobium sp. 930_D9_N1_4 TaxID=3240374 RepID=UPI003F8A4D6B